MSAVELVEAAGLAYLASPYSHDDPAVRHSRFLAAERALVWLINTRIYAISPIVLWHETAHRQKLPGDAQYWGPWNGRLFFTCKRLIVLYLPDWEKSEGVKKEMSWARATKMPMYGMAEVADGYAISTATWT